MNPFTGQMQSTSISPVTSEPLVEISGDPEHVAHVSQAVAHYHHVTSPVRAHRRAANKAARKARRLNRR